MQSNQNGNASLFSALKNIDLSAFDSLAVGPGIGIDNDDWQKSKDYLIAFGGLLILDADALNRISESELGAKFFLERKFKTWITPHCREFNRLFPHIKAETNVGLARDAAKEFNISILLKGANSIVAESIWQVAPEVVLKETMQSNQNGNASLFSALKNIDLSAFDSLAVGPGIGIDNDDWQKSKDYLMAFGGLLILDADALNRISESKLGSNFFLERKSKGSLLVSCPKLKKRFLRLLTKI